MVSIHAPYIGSDSTTGVSELALKCFNPRSLHRERRMDSENSRHPKGFNPRSLHRERHKGIHKGARVNSFNPRSLHRERHQLPCPLQRLLSVSIHAPYIGSDLPPSRGSIIFMSFNPRSLHRERPAFCLYIFNFIHMFQSTLPT